ncbi:MAG: hypothetical protein ABII93_06185 [Chrysiogenia bacterium]
MTEIYHSVKLETIPRRASADLQSTSRPRRKTRLTAGQWFAV